MKKIFNIALTAALAIGMAACSDDDYLGKPVVNPQQPLMPANGITAADIVTEGGAVDLNAAGNDGSVAMLNITKLTDFPADSRLSIVMSVSDNAGMTNASTIELVQNSGEGSAIYTYVAPAEPWDAIFKQKISLSPDAATMYVSYAAYAVNGTSRVILGSVGEPQSVTVTPFAPEIVLEDTYYVYGTASATVSGAVELTHSGNAYDNPIFKLPFSVTSADVADGGWKFKVIPASTKQAGQTWDQNHALTFIGAGEKDGTLAYSSASEDVDFVTISKPGEYMLEVNVRDLTYKVSNAIPFVYVPGANNDWSTWSTKLYTDNYINYQGYANLTGDFKFTGTAGWNNDLGNYGKGDADNKLQNGSNTNFSLGSDPAGLYYLQVNLSELTYTRTRITSIGLVGEYNGWNADHSNGVGVLTPSEDNLIWEGEVTFTSSNSQFKFNMNNGWGISLGGSIDELKQTNDNVTGPAAGTYLVLLDLSSYPYQCIFEPL